MNRFIVESTAIAEVELIKLFRDPTELIARAVQPILWLLMFGQVLAQVRGIHTGQISYLAFITPGILAQSILFTGIFYGISIIWERDLGIIQKLLVSPAQRYSLVFGKAVAAGFRGILQATVIYFLARVLDVSLRFDPLAIIGMICSVMLGSGIFATLSLIIACLVKTRERFMGVGQLLTMPMFFASNAIYPLELMPNWLRHLALFNPLTYLIDALRGLVTTNGDNIYGYLMDFSVLFCVYLILLIIGVKLYPTLAE